MRKKIGFWFVMLMLWPSFGFAQAVDSSQMKLKTNGGLTGDGTNALAIAVYRASSAPSSPVTGQLWCDTTASPCTLKQWDGAAWTAPLVNAAITTQADVSSFPGTPVDGQIFYSKSPRALWVYDGTAAVWVSLGYTGYQSGANITDLYTAAAITAPGAATAATSGTAGSTSAGNYSYKVTFRNSTGGETTGGTASNTVAPGASKSNDLSSIPTGGTGTTARGVYRSKAGQDVTGPWWWVATISDNSTTTLHDGVADAALVLQTPEHNFSGALPGAWQVVNTTAATTSGGCGVSASRGTMICRASNALNTSMCSPASATSETRNGAYLDITSYASGNYTIQYRLKQLALSGDTNLGVVNPQIISLRNGTADNSPMVTWAAGVTSAAGCSASGGASITLPFSGSVHTSMNTTSRATVGAARSVNTSSPNPWPEVDALPMWVRVIKRAGTVSVFVSSDGVLYRSLQTCTGSTNTTAGCADPILGAATTSVEILAGSSGAVGGQQVWIEIDSFTLTVN